MVQIRPPNFAEVIQVARKFTVFSALISACFLFVILGCSKNAATASNFEDGLDHYFQANPECTDFVRFPRTLSYEDPQLDSLVGLGLVTKTIGPPEAWGEKPFIYDLTAAGHAAASSKKPTALCYGTKRVERIVNFTEPGEGGSGGTKESSVTYIWRLTNIPAWAQSLATNKHWSNTDVGAELRSDTPPDKRKGEALMVLTHLGWRVAALDGQLVDDDGQ